MKSSEQITPAHFKPVWWLRNAHVQTLFPLLDCYFKKIDFRHEHVDLPDGDFLELAFCGNPDAPCLLMLPGTEGSVRSPYIKMMTQTLLAMGWQVAVMQYRSCGKKVNHYARAYNSLDTSDFEFVLSYLFLKHQIKIDYAVGFSMGGNILVHYLKTHPHSLKAVVCVSTPFDIYETAYHLPMMYQKYLLRTLVRKAHEKLDQGIELPITRDKLNTLKTMPDFDDCLTAPLYGFNDVEHYYKSARCFPLLQSIRTPTLMVYASDDPFIPAHTVPSQSACSDCVTLLATRYGGHLGFVSGGLPFKKEYWYIDQVCDFLQQHGLRAVE